MYIHPSLQFVSAFFYMHDFTYKTNGGGGGGGSGGG